MCTTAEFQIAIALQCTEVSYLSQLDFHVRSHKINGEQMQRKHKRQMTSANCRRCKTCKLNDPAVFGWVPQSIRKWVSTSIQVESCHFMYFYRIPIFKNKKPGHFNIYVVGVRRQNF
jgi:hypothetical protein